MSFLQSIKPFLLVCLLVSAEAQTAQPGPEMATRESVPTFTGGVNLVLVPVIVRDKQGKPVGTLRQEDFQLFDKNKPQLITKFSLEKRVTTRAIEAPPPAEPAAPGENIPPIPGAPNRFVAYLIDDMHLTTADLLRVRQAAVQHLESFDEPNTRSAIYTTSGRTRLEFTDDREQLRAALNRILPQTSALAMVRNCPDVSFYQADLIINKNDTQALAAAIQETIVCMMLPTDDPSTPATAEGISRATSYSVLATGGAETTLVLKTVEDVIRRMAAAPGSRMIVLASPGFFLTLDHRSEENALLDRAIRANVTINSLDARGLYTVLPGGDISEPGPIAPGTGIKEVYRLASASANSDILAELANGTGGKFFQNDNGLREGLKQLADQPEYVYVVGFSPQNLKLDGAFHTLRVAIKNSKDLSLQSRRGYYAPNHAVSPEETAREEIREAVFSREELQDIPVEVQTQFFKSGDYQAQLTVVARMDLKRLRFRKAEDRNLDNLTVVAGLFDRNGNYVKGIERTIEMRLRDQTLAAVLNSGITVRSSFDVAPGVYSIRVVVRDSEGQIMAARNGAVQIP